jgi:hypothetical protein
MLNFVYLRSSRLNFWHFWLDSCIVNKGEKFELEMSCCTHLKDFQVVSSYFWALAVSQVASAWPVRGTGLTGVVPRCWAILSTGFWICNLCFPWLVHLHLVERGAASKSLVVQDTQVLWCSHHPTRTANFRTADLLTTNLSWSSSFGYPCINIL